MNRFLDCLLDKFQYSLESEVNNQMPLIFFRVNFQLKKFRMHGSNKAVRISLKQTSILSCYYSNNSVFS